MSDVGLEIAKRYVADENADADDFDADDLEFMAESCVAIAAERDKLRADVARLTVTYDNTCSCALADASQPAIKHAKDCPIRVNKFRRLDPGVALDRLATALHSGDEADRLKEEAQRLDGALHLACDRAGVPDGSTARRIESLKSTVAKDNAVDESLNREIDSLIAERDAFRAMVADLLASAHPHPTEHPTMTRQWARARELLKNGKLNEPTAEQRKQEASIYLEEGLAEVAKMQAERDAARSLAIEACDLASPWAVMPPNSTKELVPRLTNVGGIDVAERIKAIRKACTP